MQIPYFIAFFANYNHHFLRSPIEKARSGTGTEPEAHGDFGQISSAGRLEEETTVFYGRVEV
jgi:hypothetical protein